MNPNSDAHRAAWSAAVLLDRSDRVRIEVTGPDRAKFLHNLTTNDVKRLPEGHGVEAFVTSPQGKTLGYVTILAEPDRLLVRTDPGGAGNVLPHLAKYGVFDEVAVVDVSASTFEVHLAGPRAEDVVHAAMEGAGLPATGELHHGAASVEGATLRLVRESPLGPSGLTLIGDLAAKDGVLAALRRAGGPLGLVDLDAPAAEALRIEAGTPAFGRDVTPDNLPQEVGRDSRAINFVKGCYLGQETVARIDALGHVNKRLRGLTLGGGPEQVPPPGAAVEADGKRVGTVTSSAFSPALGRPVALGYVRTSHANAGTVVTVAWDEIRAPAEIADLPFPTPGGHVNVASTPSMS
jgi:folate-binding protein YgfZ